MVTFRPNVAKTTKQTVSRCYTVGMKTMTYCPIPARSKLFSGLTSDQSREMMNVLGAQAIEYEKGETIIHQWTPVTHYYAVVSGEVHSFCIHTDGKRSVNGAFQPGDVFDIVFAFSELKSHPSAAVAVTDSVVLKIPIVDIIHNTILISTEVRRQYLQNVVNEISQSAYLARLRAFVLSRRTIKGRVMTYLNEQSKRYKSIEFDIPFDRQEFADFLESDRCALSSALCKMKSEGLVDYSKNHFVVRFPVE